MVLRIGQGIDVHQLVKGRPLIIGGVTIPFERGLLGHSDADVLTHAIIDGMLGAIGSGDIGTHFPDSDATWKDASSLKLLKTTWSLVKEGGWSLVNLDCSILAQVPKLSPHIPMMKENYSKILDCPIDACGIKVTTTEKLGFVGREEGILASAVVLLQKE